MTGADEFIEYCKKTLEVNFGQLSGGIIKKVKSKKDLDDNSTINDFKEFISVIEINISKLSGKDKATDICNVLMTKAVEDLEKPKKIVPDISIGDDLDKEINKFLAENTLPAEDDINDYAKYLTMKYGVDTRNVKKDIIQKVKIHIKDCIALKKVSNEIDNFLSRYPQPEKTDVDDFINYLRLSNMCSDENELREHIEKERLFRKFHGKVDEDVVQPTEIDQLLDSIETFNDKDEINEAMKEQKLSYLITSDPRNSDPLMSEFIELMTPDKDDIEDALSGMGLDHMIKKKNK